MRVSFCPLPSYQTRLRVSIWTSARASCSIIIATHRKNMKTPRVQLWILCFVNSCSIHRCEQADLSSHLAGKENLPEHLVHTASEVYRVAVNLPTPFLLSPYQLCHWTCVIVTLSSPATWPGPVSLKFVQRLRHRVILGISRFPYETSTSISEASWGPWDLLLPVWIFLHRLCENIFNIQMDTSRFIGSIFR